jgi:hypothetical protein
MALKLCSECGAPEMITGEHEWLNNGGIVQGRRRSHRMVFVETEILDPLFRGIAEIIGMSIEDIIIAAVRRSVRSYLKAFVPVAVSDKI